MGKILAENRLTALEGRLTATDERPATVLVATSMNAATDCTTGPSHAFTPS